MKYWIRQASLTTDAKQYEILLANILQNEDRQSKNKREFVVNYSVKE